MEPTKQNTFIISTGAVQYGIGEDGVESIEDVIQMLQQAQKEGAEYVMIATGNYRGAQYQTLRAEGDFAADLD